MKSGLRFMATLCQPAPTPLGTTRRSRFGLFSKKKSAAAVSAAPVPPPVVNVEDEVVKRQREERERLEDLKKIEGWKKEEEKKRVRRQKSTDVDQELRQHLRDEGMAFLAFSDFDATEKKMEEEAGRKVVVTEERKDDFQLPLFMQKRPETQEVVEVPKPVEVETPVRVPSLVKVRDFAVEKAPEVVEVVPLKEKEAKRQPSKKSLKKEETAIEKPEKKRSFFRTLSRKKKSGVPAASESAPSVPTIPATPPPARTPSEVTAPTTSVASTDAPPMPPVEAPVNILHESSPNPNPSTHNAFSNPATIPRRSSPLASSTVLSSEAPSENQPVGSPDTADDVLEKPRDSGKCMEQDQNLQAEDRSKPTEAPSDKAPERHIRSDSREMARMQLEGAHLSPQQRRPARNGPPPNQRSGPNGQPGRPPHLQPHPDMRRRSSGPPQQNGGPPPGHPHQRRSMTRGSQTPRHSGSARTSDEMLLPTPPNSVFRHGQRLGNPQRNSMNRGSPRDSPRHPRSAKTSDDEMMLQNRRPSRGPQQVPGERNPNTPTISVSCPPVQSADSSDSRDDSPDEQAEPTSFTIPPPIMLPPSCVYTTEIKDSQRDCETNHRQTIVSSNLHHRIQCMVCACNTSAERHLCTYCALRFCSRCKTEFTTGKSVDQIRTLATAEDWLSETASLDSGRDSEGNVPWEIACALEEPALRSRGGPRIGNPPPPRRSVSYGRRLTPPEFHARSNGPKNGAPPPHRSRPRPRQGKQAELSDSVPLFEGGGPYPGAANSGRRGAKKHALPANDSASASDSDREAIRKLAGMGMGIRDAHPGAMGRMGTEFVV